MPPSRRVVTALCIGGLLLVAGALAARGALWYQTGDFFCLYHGAASLLGGHDPYDQAWWQSVTGGSYPDPWRGSGASSCVSHYAYPLWTAVALLPIGALPLEPAATLWMAISIGAAVFGASALWRAYGGTPRYAGLFATLVFTSQPFWVLVVGGQITGLLLGLVGWLASSLATRRDASGGVALALLALKPQLVVLTLPAMALDALRLRRRRFVVAAGIAGAVMVLVPLAFIPAWPLEWLGQVGPQRLHIAALLPTAWGVAGDLLGNVAWGAVIAVAVIAATALIARDVDPLALLALTLPLSLVVTPHAWSYDHLVLVASWAFVLARLDRAAPRTRVGLLIALLVIAAPAPWLLYRVGFARGLETLSVLVPIANALLVATATRVTTSRIGASAAATRSPRTADA